MATTCMLLQCSMRDKIGEQGEEESEHYTLGSLVNVNGLGRCCCIASSSCWVGGLVGIHRRRSSETNLQARQGTEAIQQR